MLRKYMTFKKLLVSTRFFCNANWEKMTKNSLDNSLKNIKEEMLDPEITPEKLVNIINNKRNEILNSENETQDSYIMKQFNQPNYLESSSLFGPIIQKYYEHRTKFWLKTVPDWSVTSLDDVENATSYSQTTDVQNRVYWAPVTQKLSPSDEFLEYLDDYSYHQNQYDYKKSFELVEAFLNEGLKDTPFDYVKNFTCLPCKIMFKIFCITSFLKEKLL